MPCDGTLTGVYLSKQQEIPKENDVIKKMKSHIRNVRQYLT
jgi:hypothetical protein